MVRVDFRVLERFEGYRGQGFGVVVQRRKLSNAYVSSLFRIMFDEVFEAMFDAGMWEEALTEAGMPRVWEGFADIQRAIDRQKQDTQMNSDVLDDIREWANTQWDVPNVDLAGFKPLTSAELERIEKHFERLLKQFAKAQRKPLKRLKPGEIGVLPLQDVMSLQIKKSLLYLRPLNPVYLALCVSLEQSSPAKTFIEIELALCHKDTLKNAPSEFITLKALKGEEVSADITIHASICPVCGNLSEDGKLCKTCRADKHYLKKVLDYLKDEEKQAFLNGTANLDELWSELKADKDPDLAYRLKTLYHKAPKLIPYLAEISREAP